jgi:hypothetical protein
MRQEKLQGSSVWNKLANNPSETYQYRGKLVDNSIQGKGEFKWPDGRQYFGEFLRGTMNGFGKLTWTDQYGGKATYKGEFVNNLFHGKGRLIWSNGDIYEGTFNLVHNKLTIYRNVRKWKLLRSRSIFLGRR